jgi:Polysaccharide deacetylase/Secretion system C-terminal sorting domain
MKRVFFYMVVILITHSVNLQTVDSLYEVATWQDFRTAAVTFTFDDNTQNQTSVMLPIFDDYGYKMTFFPVINWGPNWTALQEAALHGHEIGSHTVSHTDLSSLTIDQQRDEFKNSRDVINSNISGQQCLTIAYPFCVAGNSSICKTYYLAARTCSGLIVSNSPADFMSISSIICGNMGQIKTKTDFINKANTAIRSNGWVVFLIHAIDEESGYSSTSSTEIKGALDYFSGNDTQFWVSTFSNVARYIKERNNVSVKDIVIDESLINMSVSDTLDNSIFNIPLTIKRVLPQDWTSARAFQNDKEIDSKIINENEENYIMFDVVPDSGNIKLIKAKTTNISDKFRSQPQNWLLMQNYPNPFNPLTSIKYSVPRSSHITLKVYNILGKEVLTLFAGVRSGGNYTTTLDGSKLSSGIYFYQLKAENYVITKKLMLLK